MFGRVLCNKNAKILWMMYDTYQYKYYMTYDNNIHLLLGGFKHQTMKFQW